MSKSMPPASFTCWMSRLLPFFEPRALPSTATAPSWMATTGLMDSTPPANAAVLEMRPPFCRYSNVSSSATKRMRPFASSSSETI